MLCRLEGKYNSAQLGKPQAFLDAPYLQPHVAKQIARILGWLAAAGCVRPRQQMNRLCFSCSSFHPVLTQEKTFYCEKGDGASTVEITVNFTPNVLVRRSRESTGGRALSHFPRYHGSGSPLKGQEGRSVQTSWSLFNQKPAGFFRHVSVQRQLSYRELVMSP